MPGEPPGPLPTEAALADVVCVSHFLALFGRTLRLCRRHIEAPALEEALIDPGSHYLYIARLVRALLSHVPDLELDASEPSVVFPALMQVLREHVPGKVFPDGAYYPDSRRPHKIEHLTPYVLTAVIKTLCDMAAEGNPAVRSAIDKDIESRTSMPSGAAAAAASTATADAPVMRVDAGGVRMNRPLGWDSDGRSYYLVQPMDESASGVRVFSEEPSAPGRIGGGATTLQAFCVGKLDAAAATLDLHAEVQRQKAAAVTANRPAGAGNGGAGDRRGGNAPPLATVPAARAAEALRVVRAAVAAAEAARAADDDAVETEDEVEAADAAAVAGAARSQATSPGFDDLATLRHRTRGAAKRKTRSGSIASAGQAERDSSGGDSSSSSGSSRSGRDVLAADGSASGDSPSRGRRLRSTKRLPVRHVRSLSVSSSGRSSTTGTASHGQSSSGVVADAAAAAARRRTPDEAAAKVAAAAARERRAADRAARLAGTPGAPPPVADGRPMRSLRETRALLNGARPAPPAAEAPPPPPSSPPRPPGPSRRTRRSVAREGGASLPAASETAPPPPPGGRRASRSAATPSMGGVAAGSNGGGGGSDSSGTSPGGSRAVDSPATTRRTLPTEGGSSPSSSVPTAAARGGAGRLPRRPAAADGLGDRAAARVGRE